MNFASDNCAGIAPEIMAAIQAANTGYHHSYGADAWTESLDGLFSDLFEREVRVFNVLTGGAANCLALGTIVPSYGVTLCHGNAHIHTDECGGAGFYTGGSKLELVEGAHGKIDPQALIRAAGNFTRGVHSPQPAMLSLTQATEWGTVYTAGEIAALADIARTHKLTVHMDGARFANAVAHLGCAPADITWRAGVDVLSFGATKNGAMMAEALVFFDPAQVRDFEFRRKQAGHLPSKMRFVSAQWQAYLNDGLWLRLAGHANAMAMRLATGLRGLEDITLAAPVEANELFVAMPEARIAALENAGADFYRWPDPGGPMIRLVTNWATTEDEADWFLETIRSQPV